MYLTGSAEAWQRAGSTRDKLLARPGTGTLVAILCTDSGSAHFVGASAAVRSGGSATPSTTTYGTTGTTRYGPWPIDSHEGRLMLLRSDMIGYKSLDKTEAWLTQRW